MVLAARRAPCALRSCRRGVLHVRPPILLLGNPASGATRSSARERPCLVRRYTAGSGNLSNNDSSQDSSIVIVGGGPCGLLMSLYLSKYRVPSVLFERQTPNEMFRHPQAHFLNTRTMEILRFDFPSVYSRIQECMAPVEEWKDFVFCTSVLDGHVRPLARVGHPVERPLLANRDANGTLLPVDQDEEGPIADPETQRSEATAPHHDLAQELSICSVGHLPQHTLCQILHEHAAAASPSSSSSNTYGRLRYGCGVTEVDLDRPPLGVAVDPFVTVRTLDGSSGASASVQAPFVVAADGAHSRVRQVLGIRQAGREAMQHLINIHVVLDEESRRQLQGRPAMLYSVFHPTVIAMVVCHNAADGEYVIQIPYFPPYQNPERNFGEARVRELVSAIFGLRGVASSPGFRIQSVKPWAMSALVATEYHRGRVALVGDAAHVFPPAGGFGMNTGLQDVQNLAWRLAHLYHSGRLFSEPSATALSTNKGREVLSPVQTMLQQYETERRFVAQQNAALSTRNYRRLLQVHKALYLDEQHPALLCRALDAARLVPLSAKRVVFETGFRAALQPLAAMQNYTDATKKSAYSLTSPADWYGSHLVSNLRRVLGSGAGLPLLFPKYELGFSYDGASSSTSDNRVGCDDEDQPLADWKRDTWADPPTLRVDSLVPHVRVRLALSFSNPSVLDLYPHLIRLDENEDEGASAESRMTHGPTFSTSNLPSQLTQDGRPVFVLLLVGCDEMEFESLVEGLSDRLDSDVVCLRIVPSSMTEVEIQDHHRTLRGLVVEEQPSPFSFFQGESSHPYLILIRPDSHVHSITELDTTKTTMLLNKMVRATAD